MTIVKASGFVRQYESKSTRATYLYILKKFFKQIYPDSAGNDLDALSEKYIESKPDYREDLLDFRDNLTDLAPKSRLTNITAILRFLEDNEIDFPKAFRKNLFGKDREVLSEEYIPTNADLERFIEHLPLIGKSIVLVLSSSGMRIGECLSLELSDIDLTREPVRVYLRSKKTKTKKKRLTFISSEAKAMVEEWMRNRSEWMRVAQARSTFEIEQNDRVFPISKEGFMDIWKRASSKAQLLKIDKNTKRQYMRPHSLRKFFRTRGNWIRSDIAECLLGHNEGIKSVYTRYDQAEDELVKDYLIAEKHLSIRANSKTVSELRYKLDLNQIEMTGLKADVNKQVQFVLDNALETIRVLSDKVALLEARDQRLSEIEYEQEMLASIK